MFKLEKIYLDRDTYSRVREGSIQQGDSLTLFLAGTKERKRIDSPSDVEVGYQLLLARSPFSWLNTSPIQEILERGEDFVTFHTQTSIYRLTEIKEESNLD